MPVSFEVSYHVPVLLHQVCTYYVHHQQSTPSSAQPSYIYILVAHHVILDPAIGQFREFEPRRVHTRINSLGLFLVHIDLRKARERELATLDEKSTSSGIAKPYARQKLKARTGGEKGRHL